MDKTALMERNLYELFELPVSASVQDIKKAYRKKALKCHPDKNPDNPNAVRLFLELSTALEILIEESSKAVYDKLLQARQAAKIRHDALDSKRKKLKEDLEAREKLASSFSQIHKDEKSSDEKLAAEIERLRKEGSRQLLEEMEKVKQQMQDELFTRQSELDEDGSSYRLKVKWKSEKGDEKNGGYSTDNLHLIFSKYGDISCLVVSQKKNGSALLEFEKKNAAIKAFQLERGFGTNPLTLSWLSEVPNFNLRNSTNEPAKRCAPLDQCGQKGGLFPSFAQGPAPSHKPTPQHSSIKTEEDFEALVLAKMREVQQKKDL